MAKDFVFTMMKLGKVYPPSRTVLKDINLSFYYGAKIGVLGLNGAGKSTLLKIMAGIEKEFTGEAIPGKRNTVGYLPQEPQLDPKLTARKYETLFHRHIGWISTPSFRKQFARAPRTYESSRLGSRVKRPGIPRIGDRFPH